jgi:hypothetical protein
MREKWLFEKDTETGMEIRFIWLRMGLSGGDLWTQ